ncbi:cupin domain-containing protein [Hyphomonas sp.]|uniref:cupin domain-containing protein n=1 Tax=Hyphomonas sp. TaxID=87 RepID=UPI003F72F435
MTEAVPDTAHRATSTGFEIYRAREAQALSETSHMDYPDVTPEVESGIIKATEAGAENGQVVKTLFSRPGFSLTYAWFKSGFPLPRHTHNADCLYYVIAGSLQLGSKELGAGDGFFVGEGKVYSYTPGPNGVEVLEFRTQEDFDVRFLVKSAENWAKIIDKVSARQSDWAIEVPPGSSHL